MSEGEARRKALFDFMTARKLRAHSWATRAGVSSGSIYAFLKGETKSLSTQVYERLAAVEGVTISELMGKAALPDAEANYLLAATGELTKEAPDPEGAAYCAAIAADDFGWIKRGNVLYFRPADPAQCYGRLAVVTTGGHLKLREIRRGYAKGLFNLISPAGSMEEDAEITDCRVVEWVRTA